MQVFSRFATIFEYKAKLYGRFLVKVAKYFASSQICNVCVCKNEKVKDLSIRTYTCPSCGMKLKRDENAGKNILVEGIKQLSMGTAE